MPKISVIMGVYNVLNEKMLKDAVYSVLNQSFKDFEFIICNDCSNEETESWLLKLVAQDSRIIYIKNEKNMGLAHSLNHCFKYAKGEYIARQDADDISVKERFEKQVNFLDNNKDYALVGSCINYFDEDGIYGELKHAQKPQNKDFLFTSPFCHGSIMIRKAVLTEMNGYRAVRETLRCEDYDLFMRMYLKGYKGYNIQDKLYCFREDKEAWKRRRKYSFRIDEAKIRAKYFKKLGIGFKRYFYIIKPLIVGLIPVRLLVFARKIYYSNRKI